jgi:hypothetical protein
MRGGSKELYLGEGMPRSIITWPRSDRDDKQIAIGL